MAEQTMLAGIPAVAAAGILLAFAAAAQEESVDASTQSDEIALELEELRTGIEAQRTHVAEIENRVAAAEDGMREILNIRLERERIELLAEGVRFAETVARHREAGYEIEDFQTAAVALLRTHAALFEEAWAHVHERTALPASDQGAAEQAAADRILFDLQRNKDRLIALTADSFALLDGFGADAQEAETAFEARLRERAIDASIMLDMALEEAAGVRAGLNALPGDSELSAKLSVAENRVAQTAASLERVVDELNALGGEVSDYRQQLLTATGEITPAAFDFAVAGDLLSSWSQSMLELIASEGPAFLFRVLLVSVILFVFYKLARLTRQIVAHSLTRSGAAVSQLLRRMIVATVANLILAAGILIALSQLGVSLGPVLAGLGIAGFIIGFALQDSLSNFASGLLILFNRPYDVGDTVEVGGVLGKVHEMSLVNTTIHTFDNQRVILPNTMIWNNVIKNVTAQKIRRVDLVFGISYSDDIPKTELILENLLKSHELVLDEPAPDVRLHELGDSSVNFVVRPWAKTEDYWTVYWEITRAVKLRFDEEGISIPFPQRDIHLMPEGIAQAQNQPVASIVKE